MIGAVITIVRIVIERQYEYIIKEEGFRYSGSRLKQMMKLSVVGLGRARCSGALFYCDGKYQQFFEDVQLE